MPPPITRHHPLPNTPPHSRRTPSPPPGRHTSSPFTRHYGRSLPEIKVGALSNKAAILTRLRWFAGNSSASITATQGGDRDGLQSGEPSLAVFSALASALV